MATFEQNGNLIETGLVSYVVTITGGGETWRLTSADEVLTGAGGEEYLPVPLMTNNLKEDGSMSGSELEVSLPRSLTLADRFFPEATGTVYKVVIKKAHHDEGIIKDAPLAFTGIVTSASSSQDPAELKLVCSTQQGLLARTGLRRRYQLQCPYLLYGSECRASKAAARFQANISAPTTTSFADVEVMFYGEDADAPEIWRGRDMSLAENRVFLVGSTITFAGGDYKVRDIGTYGSPNHFRLRLFASDIETLRDAVSSAAPEDRVCVITPNCDHTTKCCAEVFSNGPNYGGMPLIPSENPVKQMFFGG